VTEVAEGTATATMTVRADMVNGHDITHGAFVFAVADTAFACACNSHGPTTVAAAVDITFVAPSHAGDVLEARAAAERQRDACIALFQSELGTDPGPAVMRAAEAQALRESTQYVPNRAAIEARLEAALAAQDAGASEAAIASLRAAVTDADDIGDRELQGRALLALGSALARSPRPGRRGRRNAAPGNQGR